MQIQQRAATVLPGTLASSAPRTITASRRPVADPDRIEMMYWVGFRRRDDVESAAPTSTHR